MDANGDYVFGQGSTWLVNSPAAVAQAVQTRMRLLTEEWFLDLSEGLDKSLILGVRTQGTRDQQVQQRILGTPGVKSITAYASNVNTATRGFTAAVTLDTIYGAVSLTIDGTPTPPAPDYVLVDAENVYVDGESVIV